MTGTRHGALVAMALLAAGAAPAAARVVTTDAGGCRVELERREVEPAVLLFRADCELSLAAARAALDELLDALFPDHRIPADVRSVSVGRPVYLPWLSERLATAAARDPGWNAAKGRPRHGTDNAYVAALLERERLYEELAAVLATRGGAVKSASVEKVLVAQARSLPFADRLRAAGIPGEARLPFDAQLWLVLGAR